MSAIARPLRTAIVVALAAAGLGGCLGAGSPVAFSDQRSLAESGSGVLVVHTSLHEEGCREVSAALSKPVMSGRSIDIGRTVTLKRSGDGPKTPSPVVLPAGEYGIVRFTCEGRDGTQVYAANAVENGSYMDGSGTVYEAPLVSFRVGPGEIVEGGSVRIAAAAPAGSAPGRLAVTVAPLPEGWLQAVPSAYASLAGGRVSRPVAVPGSPTAANRRS